jgi:hypothetical protein
MASSKEHISFIALGQFCKRISFFLESLILAQNERWRRA